MATIARFLALIVVAAVFAGCSQVNTAPDESSKKPVDIEGTDGEGRYMSLGDFRGKVVLLDFWFTNCHYCRVFNKAEHEIIKRFENRPFVILGVNEDETRQMLVETQKTDHLLTRSWWDGEGSSIATRWRVRGFPTLILIDHTGRVRDRMEGFDPRILPDINRKIDDLVREAELGAANGGK